MALPGGSGVTAQPDSSAINAAVTARERWGGKNRGISTMCVRLPFWQAGRIRCLYSVESLLDGFQPFEDDVFSIGLLISYGNQPFRQPQMWAVDHLAVEQKHA